MLNNVNMSAATKQLETLLSDITEEQMSEITQELILVNSSE
jgi:hypothetical protein